MTITHNEYEDGATQSLGVGGMTPSGKPFPTVGILMPGDRVFENEHFEWFEVLRGRCILNGVLSTAEESSLTPVRPGEGLHIVNEVPVYYLCVYGEEYAEEG